jgi:hypothetical protein
MGEGLRHTAVHNGKGRAYPGEDASNAAVELYGLNAGARENVSVSHWKFKLENAGGRALFEQCQVLDESGSVIASEYRDDLQAGLGRRYLVRRGQDIQVEFTYENTGKSVQEIAISYRLSTNDLITMFDPEIGFDSWMRLGRNSVYEKAYPVTIPEDLVVGQEYFIGVWVDANEEVDEHNENDNKTYLVIRIVE